MSERMRIAFFGSGAFGLPTLRALMREHEVALIVTQPDKPAGRGGALTATSIGEVATKEFVGTPMIKPVDANVAEVTNAIRDGHGQVDAWVVIAFGQKMGEALLKDRFALNLHASLLPRWRGAAPIHAAILAGDLETGNSVITLAQRMDAGLVLATTKRMIEPTHTTATLHDLLAEDGAPAVLDVLAKHAAGTLVGAAQDESRATRARKLSRDDAWIDFGDAKVCRARVHALNAWPGVTVQVVAKGVAKNDWAGAAKPEELKLWRVEEVDGDTADARSAKSGFVPGTLIDAEQGMVACAVGALRLVEVQSPGKKAMAWDDLQRGRKFATGTMLIGKMAGTMASKVVSTKPAGGNTP